MADWLEGDHDELAVDQRWPLAPAHLLPRERWLWWEQLWSDVIAVRERYRISPGNYWWEDGVKVEALAAPAGWVARYDSGEWDDPPGKLALLYDIERVRQLIKGGEPFDARRDRVAFDRFLIDSGCQPRPGHRRRPRVDGDEQPVPGPRPHPTRPGRHT